MPTATKFFGTTITNFGPLTTTYTPSPSCTTVTTDHLLYAVENVTGPYQGSPRCEHNLVGDCIPEGSSYDLLASKLVGPWELGFFNYHSPGIYCPKGWTTAAVLGHGDKSGSQLRSGAFTITRTPSTLTRPSILQPDEIWLSLLEPSETLAFCCPIGWDGIEYGICATSIEHVSSSNHKGICVQEYDPRRFEVATVHTVEGEPVSGSTGVLSAVPWTGTWSEQLEMLTDVLPNPNRTFSLIVIRTLPAVPLVYKSSDVEAARASIGDGGENNSNDDDNKDDTKEVDENGSGATALPNVFELAPAIAVLAGVLTGAGLLMPW
ncbi:hypothetical protein FLAG1_04351 [Fusarium langsethiae]|uniref:Uncharacterized protein n=1 Tax=Fusarium langsethiae TaxID=179993 RepID=A0A0M9EZJ1_FUSLA|nr:hypothetical protein FLAG1_04351 [Fusarium langsethiae]GKU06501.1 unnamed protein product [Fusarium langsethiae]GKU11721.1 unnamed protein product [Fusarium langsethiae]